MDERDLTEDADDWFDRPLDELFVQQALIREPSANERQAQAERDRRRATESRGLPRSRSRNRSRGPSISARVALLAVFVVVFGLIVQDLVWKGNAGVPTATPAVLHGGGDGLISGVQSASHPTPSSIPSLRPLHRPPPAPIGAGSHKFIATQPTGDRPVAYDPCRKIHYVVNEEAATAPSRALLASAIARVSAATGLEFVNDGATDETVADHRPAFQPNRYGDRWAPVLFWWTTPTKAPKLRGDVAGYAGSAYVDVREAGINHSRAYVSGTVVLDGPDIADVAQRAPGHDRDARAIILHELGHLVGLDHVNDTAQLMNPTNTGAVDDYRGGDRRGLVELGRGECFPKL